jgi:subtilisin family serine protease
LNNLFEGVCILKFRRYKRLLITSAVLILFPVTMWWIWYSGEILSPSLEHFGTKQEARVSRQAINEVLAEDLSLTTQMFVKQLDAQVERWAENDWGDEQLRHDFKEELREHSHFQSFAVVETGQVTHSAGEWEQPMPQNAADKLARHEDDSYYSDPYECSDGLCMWIAREKDNEQWIVGEVDLSFVSSYVKDMASVADASGNFFIGGEDPEVEYRSEDTPTAAAEEDIPVLDWKIVVYSDPEADREARRHYVEGEVIVRFTDEEVAQAWFERHPQFVEREHIGAYYVVQKEGEGTTTGELMDQLQHDPEIVTVEPNIVFEKQQVDTLPNDEFFEPYQWNLSNIEVEEGWELTEGEEDIIIAVLDTGVDPDHQDLAGKLVDGFNAFTNGADYDDQHGHGTHVAGISAAITNNVTGIAGVSWYNPIMPVKVLDERGEGSLYEIAKGIMWAADQGARVINMSLGDEEPSDMLHDAIRYAYEKDVVLIAATGNENVDTPMYPAAYDEVLAVGAVDQRSRRAVFSNYGRHLHVMAPGENIPSTFLDDQYVFMSGTSMAAPHASGLAGLILSLRPDLSNDEVMELIQMTAADLGKEGWDPVYGYGQIDVGQALSHLQNDDLFPFRYDAEIERGLDTGDGEVTDGEQRAEEAREEDQRLTRLHRWVREIVRQLSTPNP